MNQKARDILANIVGAFLGIAVILGHSAHGDEKLTLLSTFEPLGRAFAVLGQIPDWDVILIGLDAFVVFVFIFPSVHMCVFEIIAGRPHQNTFWLNYPLAMVGFLIVVGILTWTGVAKTSQAILIVMGLALLVAILRRMWTGRS